LNKPAVICIVDDNERFGRATGRLISSLGHAAAVFFSAEEFLKSDRLDEAACLIADVQMPGMSGIELQTHLAARGHRLPIIFITAYPEAKTRQQALASGALGFLAKPFNEDELISCLDRALAKGRA
jgi:FixJ family two-component response regulator